MTARSFVDTNIWVYAVDEDEPAKQERAKAALATAEMTGIVVSAQVLGEFYVTVTRKLATPLPQDAALDYVHAMMRQSVVSLDARLVSAAIAGTREWGIAYWDALIIAAAEAGGCSTVLTEDLQHGATYGSVRVENPFLTARPPTPHSVHESST